MAQVPSALERLAALKIEVKELERAALSELVEKKSSITRQLIDVNAQIAELTGNNPESRKLRGGSAANSTPSRQLTLQELMELLSAAPEKTVGIRKENLDLPNIKTLAAANPHLLRLGRKGPWPTVTLLK